MKKFYHTLVLVSDVAFAGHPRFVNIAGEDIEVAASADGHSLAEMGPLKSLVTDLANGQFAGLEEYVEEGVQTAALEAQDASIRQKEYSYNE